MTAIEKLMEKQMEMMANVSKTQLEMLSSLNNSVQKLASKMDEISVSDSKGKAEGRLPSQAESNPRTCVVLLQQDQAEPQLNLFCPHLLLQDLIYHLN